MEDTNLVTLRKEMLQLSEAMQQFRRELASIRHPDAPEDRFVTMADQMDAIVKGTEQSADQILQAAEGISDVIHENRNSLLSVGDGAVADQLEGHVASIFEACAFQDLTGQRTAKVVESLKFVDTRINRLVALWGVDKLSKEPMPQGKNTKLPAGEQLDGPALEGQGVSQADVDSLFDDEPAIAPEPVAEEAGGNSQEDIDKLFEEEGREVSQDDIDKLFD